MPETASAPRRSRGRIRPWAVWLILLVAIATAGTLTTRFVSIEDAEAAASGSQFDPATYADERFDSEIVPAVEADAIELPTLLQDLAGGADESDFGHAPGAGSSYSFPVDVTGTAGAPNGAILPVTVDGVPADVTVQVQIGPAINGTALRDVTGTVSFNEFTNQLEFQEVATEFNNRVREGVLAGVDPSQLEGKRIHVIGAFTRVNPALVSIVPVSFEIVE